LSEKHDPHPHPPPQKLGIRCHTNDPNPLLKQSWRKTGSVFFENEGMGKKQPAKQTTKNPRPVLEGGMVDG